MKMTSRERIMAVINGKKPDRIPWVPLIGRYYVSSLPSMGINLDDIVRTNKVKPPAVQKNLNLYEIETIKYVGADVLYRHVDSYRIIYHKSKEFTKIVDGVKYEGFETPVGTIFSKTENATGTEFITKKLVESYEDIKVLMHVMKNVEVQPNYQDYLEFDEYIADDGIATLTGPLTPLQLMLQFYMGIEKTTYALMDYPEEMEELFKLIHEFNQRVYKIMAEAPAMVIISYEDTSTTVISPKWYEDFCSNQLNTYADILHSGSKTFIVHMCGKISRIVNLIAKGKMDGIDSVCPPTPGDIEPGEALSKLGKIIIGGLDPALLQRMSVEDVEAYTLSKLRQIDEKDRFMLSTGDSTAYGTPLENLKAVTETINNFG
ncbi:MAG: hypothetical protein KGZ94_09915 [Clostridia bacterium]|nr:hypothetical protein [Clostridia bacterium]